MLSLPELIINIEPWPVEGRDIELNVSAEDLKKLVANEDVEAPDILSPLDGSLSLHLTGRRLRVKGNFNVKVRMTCDRCLNENEYLLGSGEIDEVLDLIKEGESILEDQDEDLCLNVIDGQVNLSSLLSELFWLAWPYRYICRENCAGLCLRCGKDLNQGLCGCLQDNEILN